MNRDTPNAENDYDAPNTNDNLTEAKTPAYRAPEWDEDSFGSFVDDADDQLVICQMVDEYSEGRWISAETSLDLEVWR